MQFADCRVMVGTAVVEYRIGIGRAVWKGIGWWQGVGRKEAVGFNQGQFGCRLGPH